jgi:hypothetical protein
MAMHKGEIYRCPDPDCGCEVEVTRGPKNENDQNDNAVRCCCGREMEKS